MNFDIIIIGGGMVGATLAHALQQNSPFNIALIDAAPLVTPEDHRLIALNHSSVCLLQNLDIWSHLKTYAAPINEVHVSHRGHFGATRLNASAMNLATLGHVIPAQYINLALQENLKNITIFRPATLKHLTQNANQVSLDVETDQGEKKLTTKILIGADGTYSTVRHLLNIETKEIDYQQSALVTTTTLNRPHHGIAYERFLQEGAIAMLPLINNQCATIWTGKTENILQLLQLSDAEFLSQLQKQFGYRLGKLIKISNRYSYPLKSIQINQQTHDRVILMGNAAHTLHPIAAQGLNLSFYEIAALVEHFGQHSLDATSLVTFTNKQQKLSTHLSHHLSSLFSKDFLPLNFLRQTGMVGLDLSQKLKKDFALKMLGRSSNMPNLLMENDQV